MHDYRQALTTAVEAARAAGTVLREEFHRAGGPRGNGDHADADEAAERMIRQRLLNAEHWSYLGEETGRASGDPEHVWLVDPNDGTSSYMAGLRGSAVSIAALRDGVPVLGVVYAFAYPDDEGDLIAWAEGCGPLTRNGRPANVRLEANQLGRDSIILVSQDADKNSAANALCVAPARFMALPSIAYRLALAAVGEGDAAVSLNGPGAWDYAAGHALVRAAGGILIDQDGHEITYAPGGASGARWCFGGSPATVRELAGRRWAGVFERIRKKTAALFSLTRPEPGRAVTDSGLLARAQGCLLGQFAGDALGALVEFHPAEWILSRYPGGVRDLADGGSHNTIAGQPTDDSEMALMLARCLVKEKRFDRAAALDSYLHWWKSSPFDYGSTTRVALRGAESGSTPAERLLLNARHGDRVSEANGSLMRVSPLGIFGHAKPERAADWAREDSALTHPSEVCREACAAFVRAIAVGLTGADARACYGHALNEARKGGVETVLGALEAAGTGPPDGFDSWKKGWVLLALQNAFFRLLHAKSFEEGVVDTVMAGGDTDTTAAICGALLGAVHGREGIPARWRRAILTCRPLAEAGAANPRPAEFWPVDALELAEALLLAGRQSVE